MRYTIWFVRTKGVLGALKRLLMLSPWDYCALQCGEDVYELHPKNGSIVRHQSFFYRNNPQRNSVVIDVVACHSVQRFLEDESSSRVSRWALLPFHPFRNWRHKLDRTPRVLLPSEYISYALECGGVAFDLPTTRVTPNLLWSQLPKYQIYFRPTSHDPTH